MGTPSCTTWSTVTAGSNGFSTTSVPSGCATDVLSEIQDAGIRHSDIQTVAGDWDPQPFPVVPGHETVGVVAEVGATCPRR